MPIVDILVVSNEFQIDPNDLQVLTNELGRIFDSPKGGTWVNVSQLPLRSYFENDSNQILSPPILMRILKYKSNHSLGEVEKIIKVVSKYLLWPQENIHIIYEPPGEGRVYFGGQPA